MVAIGALAAGGVIGSISQPIAAHFAQKRQHKYIKKYMKNKYQWEVADLIAAGLNPILGYTKGGPGIGSPGIPNIAGGQGATALSAAKLREELELLRAQRDAITATAAKTRIETRNIATDPKKAFFRTMLEGAPSAAEVRKRLKLVVEDLPVERSGKVLRDKLGGFGSVMSEQWRSTAERWKRKDNWAPARSKY